MDLNLDNNNNIIILPPPDVPNIIGKFNKNLEYNILKIPIELLIPYNSQTLIYNYLYSININYIQVKGKEDFAIILNYRNNKWSLMWNIFPTHKNNWFAKIQLKKGYIFNNFSDFKNILSIIDNYLDN